MHHLPKVKFSKAQADLFDKSALDLHYGRDHKSYVDKLNKAVGKHKDMEKWSGKRLLKEIGNVPSDIKTEVAENVGGTANHSIFWEVMENGTGGKPTGALLDDIVKTFGSFEEFQKRFRNIAVGLSVPYLGWAWLTINNAGSLITNSTAGQENPYMYGGIPLLGIDMWEHSYYVKYQNRRGDYVDDWWNVVNWDAVAKRYAAAKSGVMAGADEGF